MPQKICIRTYCERESCTLARKACQKRARLQDTHFVVVLETQTGRSVNHATPRVSPCYKAIGAISRDDACAPAKMFGGAEGQVPVLARQSMRIWRNWARDKGEGTTALDALGRAGQREDQSDLKER